MYEFFVNVMYDVGGVVNEVVLNLETDDEDFYQWSLMTIDSEEDWTEKDSYYQEAIERILESNGIPISKSDWFSFIPYIDEGA